MPEDPIVTVLVTIDDQSHQIDAVQPALEAEGCRVTDVMLGLGIIRGQVPKSKEADLRAIPGVLAVERDEDVEAI